MASEQGYPQHMVHPQHRPAVLADFDSSAGVPGSPERFPPIEVHSKDQEEAQRARGYLRYGEGVEKAIEFSQYPKCLVHPAHVDAVPASQGATMENGRLVSFPIQGVPEKYPPVFVNNAAQEKEWLAKGYGEGGHADEFAFEKAVLSPGTPGDEWPKYVDGVLTQDPDAPEDTANEYPKWLHFEGGESLLVNDAAHENSVRASRKMDPLPVKQPAKPYLPQQDSDYEQFLAWKASRDAAAKETLATMADTVDDDERQTLVALAEETGIKIDKRWGIERLREAVMGKEAAE
jgi:hypothetical protein